MSLVAAADRTNQPVFSGFDSPSDWPWTYHILVAESRRVLSYFELPKKAQPPKSIWHSPDKCNDFIEKNISIDNKDGPAFLEFTDIEQEHANR